jgi:hypothetical protein
MKPLAWILYLGAVCLLSIGCSKSVPTGKSTPDSDRAATDKERHATAISVVLAKDKQLGERAKDEIKKGSNASTVIQLCVDEMRKINLIQCPPEFQEAYLKHVYAWAELPSLVQRYEGISGTLLAFLEGAVGKYEGDAEAKRIQKGIRETFLAVETIALRYGVQQSALEPRQSWPGEYLGKKYPIIDKVEPGSVADKAGVQAGDIYISYNGISLDEESSTNDASLNAIAKARKDGVKTVVITLVRNGSEYQKTVPAGVMIGITMRVWH